MILSLYYLLLFFIIWFSRCWFFIWANRLDKILMKDPFILLHIKFIIFPFWCIEETDLAVFIISHWRNCVTNFIIRSKSSIINHLPISINPISLITLLKSINRIEFIQLHVPRTRSHFMWILIFSFCIFNCNASDSVLFEDYGSSDLIALRRTNPTITLILLNHLLITLLRTPILIINHSKCT